MKYYYLNPRQTIFNILLLVVLGVVWMAGFHGYGVFDTARAVCGVVVAGLCFENLREWLKRAGKKLYYIESKPALKKVFTGLCLTLSLLYVCEIPYDRDFVTYGSIVGVFAAWFQEYQIRQARGFKIHFDVLLLNDGTYSIGTNSTTTEVQEGVRDLSAQRLRDPKELVGKLHTILGVYENRSPDELKNRKNIEVTIDCIRV